MFRRCFSYWGLYNTQKKMVKITTPDSKVYGANMGPTWGRQVPGGPHVGPMYIAIWDALSLGVVCLWCLDA